MSNSSGSNPGSPKYQLNHSPIKTDLPTLPLYQKSSTFEKPTTEGNYDSTATNNTSSTATAGRESMLNDAEMLLVLNKHR